MVVYSIKDIEKLSGVKAHTIRIWEKRYNIICPKRTESNIRYYDDDDLKHILNISYLKKQGHKISKIAQMTEEELKKKVTEYSKLDMSSEDQLDALMLFILELDAFNFNKILDKYIEDLGLEEAMDAVIYPLLDKIGVAWLTGSFQGVHESFVVNCIKNKLVVCIDRLNSDYEPLKKILIYLPVEEKQELSLLFLHYVLKKHHCEVINVGLDITLKDVLDACQIAQPEFVFTIINDSYKGDGLQPYVNNICRSLKNCTFLITGYQAMIQNVDWPENSKLLQNLDDTISFIKDQTKILSSN